MTTATVQAPVRGGHGLGERLRWALRDGLLIAGRDVSHWVREPQLILWTLLFPIIFVLLFAYVLGSSMQVAGGGSYQQFLMSGMFVQLGMMKKEEDGGPIAKQDLERWVLFPLIISYRMV